MKISAAFLALTACLVSLGCSSKMPQNAAPLSTRAPGAVSPARKRRIVPRLAGENYILVASSENISVIPPQDTDPENPEDSRVSAVSKGLVDEEPCADSRSGHPAYLRSDLAYSVTGFDCQGDAPSE